MYHSHLLQMVTGCFHRDYARLFPRFGTDHDTTVCFWCNRDEHTGCFCPYCNWVWCSPHGKSYERTVLFLYKLSVFKLFWCHTPEANTERTVSICFIQSKYILFEVSGCFQGSICFSEIKVLITTINCDSIFLHKQIASSCFVRSLLFAAPRTAVCIAVLFRM